MKLRLNRQNLQLALDRDAGLLEAMTLPALSPETAMTKVSRTVGLVVSGGVAVALVWASFAQLNEVTQATGSLVPTGAEQVVQHLEGGMVERILVKEGAVVHKGDPLIQLRDTTTAEDDVALDRQRFDLRGQIEAQTSLFEGREPHFETSQGRFVVEEGANANAFHAAQALEIAEYARLASQASQAKLNLDVVRMQLADSVNEVTNSETEAKRFDDLFRKGVATGVQITERRQNLVRAKSAMLALVTRDQAAAERLSEIEKQMASYRAEQHSNRAQKIQDLSATLNVVDANIAKKNARKDRLVITSPTEAVVKSVDVNSVGQVVGAGQVLATLVPLNTPLIAETNVRASEIGYLRVGQTAQIRISAYDYTRFGSLEGVIDTISPSSFQTNGQYFYRVKIKPTQDHLAKAPGATLLPGMDIVGEIITGRKTVLQYIMTPLQRTLGSAFSER